MLLYYVRHGDPIYNPDSLTPFGHRQAEAVGRMLSHCSISEIYTSTSERAKLTARPLLEITKKEPVLLDFANEGHAWRDLTCESLARGCRTWLYFAPEAKALFHNSEVLSLGERWYEHEGFREGIFAEQDYKAGIERIHSATFDFLLSLGYKRVSAGKYEIVEKNDKRIALFAHQGFGLAFLSAVLGIPYPIFSTHFDIQTSCVTVIEFADDGGVCYPRILTHSSSAHLYAADLPNVFG